MSEFGAESVTVTAPSPAAMEVTSWSRAPYRPEDCARRRVSATSAAVRAEPSENSVPERRENV
ncbi:hypothetical protein SDC9_94883 [bioreactor metagenome]|uniref:Uncharacterized protein n=1 Tax=bioreactor metagenome TaxID=1076179 RepID=A0A645A4N8_9ZZZZ